jgi:hypothetical protein
MTGCSKSHKEGEYPCPVSILWGAGDQEEEEAPIGADFEGRC